MISDSELDAIEAKDYGTTFRTELESLIRSLVAALRVERAKVQNRDAVAAAFDGEEEALRAALRVEREVSSQLRAALEAVLDERGAFRTLKPTVSPAISKAHRALAVASYLLNEDAK